jgi:hypothetical protein
MLLWSSEFWMTSAKSESRLSAENVVRELYYYFIPWQRTELDMRLLGIPGC